MFLSEGSRYDIDVVPEPFWRGRFEEQADELYAPVRAWSAGRVPKWELAELFRAT